MDRAARVVVAISRYADYAARIGIVALMVLVVANVVLRYSLKSIQGTYDYVGLITAVSVTLAISYCAYERGHIEIDIFMERLPRPVQAIVGSVVMFISAGFFAIAAWQSVAVGNSMKAANETTMSVYVPLFPFMYMLAAGLAFMALVILLRCAKYVIEAVRP